MSGFTSEIIKANKNRQDHIALVDRRGKRSTKWSELCGLVCRVAAYAQKEKLSGIVPVHMERGLEAFATVLGLNLAGVGAAPLSITTPAARCEQISGQVGNPVWTLETWTKSMEETKNSTEPDPASFDSLKEADPAYVVFTSGSTGNPKGVMLSNRAMLGGMLRSASDAFFDLKEEDRVLQCSSFSFIALAADLLGPLYCGARVIVLPEEGRGDVRMIEDYVNRFGIGKLFMPPQMYRAFEGGPSLKCVCTGSDKVINIGPKGHRLVNVYGMTETAGFAFHYEIKEPMPSTPIGEPCPDLKAYVLDENGNETEEGELCISGAVAQGYYELPELSAQSFTPNPFCKEPGHEVLLHSGDIVRRIPEGGFLYLNRRDNMIKINGQRVEPGEIELAIMDFDGITSAAVKGFTDENQRSILCAYYTCNKEIDEEKLRSSLEEKLPHYMVPSIFVKRDAMPLNANGKLDRKALEMPDMRDFQDTFEAPETEAEEMLCHAFEKALHLERVGRNDDFFRIGGDSISALTVVGDCASIGISTGDVFAGRTPKSIAAMAAGSGEKYFEDLPQDLEKAELTTSQMGIFLACGMNEKGTKYNIPIHISFAREKGMTAETVKTAVDRVLEKHPALYAQISGEGDSFYMLRRNFPEGGMCKAAEGSKKDAETLAKTYIKPIALGTDPLCEVQAVLCSKEVHLFFNMHHVVSDGTSVQLLARQLADSLNGIAPEAETVDAFALKTAEDRKLAAEAESAKSWYDALLAGMETDSAPLPDGKPAPGANPGCLRISRELKLPALAEFLKAYGLTESTFFMGLYGYALAKMTGQKESFFGTVENGRDCEAVGNTVCAMVRTLPVVMDLDEEQTSAQILSKLQNQFFTSMRNNALSGADLTKEYGVRFDVMFVYQSGLLSGAESGAIRLHMENPETGESIGSWTMQVLKQEKSFLLQMEVRKDIYREETVNRFLDLYAACAENFAKNKVLKEIPLITGEDLAFLDRVNHRDTKKIPEETIVDVFRRNAARYPEKTAVIFQEYSCTYAQADEITDRIAAYLFVQGIGKGQTVSVLIPRNEYIVLASLGVIKAGAVYQPLDPSYPPERLNFMVKDAEAKLLIADRSLRSILTDYTGKVLYTDEIAVLPKAEKLPKAPEPGDVYVLLYTSGTTGMPKGCMLTHRNLRYYVSAYAKMLKLTENSVMANYASYGFDAHMADIYPCIYAGGTLTVIPDEIRLDLAAVKEFCEKGEVTHLLMTTQVARQFATQFAHVEHLETLSTGGEKLVTFDPVNNFRVLNLYGPTECTCCVTGFHVERIYDNIPIGPPMENSRIYVTDAYGRRTPVGVPGELIICGPQVGLGYLNREEQTAKAFVPNTWEETKEENYIRCYHTGDVVRFLADGNIEYIGRRDMQVKIHSFRVELGEVERAVREYPGIKDATVVAQDTEAGKRLVAYVVSDEKVDIDKLHEFIGESHPSYMVPSVTMQIERIPLTVNGKVDKKKLPQAEMHFEDVTKPENERQQKIFELASQAVGTSDFGIHTDLYEAGLNSIGSIRFCSMLAEAFGVPVRMRDLKKHATVAELESFLCGKEKPGNSVPEGQEQKITQVEKKAESFGPAHPITKTMEGIFTECMVKPGSTVYNIPCLLQISKKLDTERLKKALVRAVEAHPSMKAELFTNSEGRICQHRRLDDVFTESDIKEIRMELPETAEQFTKELSDTLVTPFVLTGSRLFEITLIHGEREYLFLNIHHIIADGTSISIFLQDVEKAYAGENLEPETFSSFDVAEEEALARSGEDLQEAKEYYGKLLEEVDKDFLLRPDKHEAQKPDAGKLVLAQKEADGARIAQFCQENHLSLNAFFVSVFGLVLARYNGTDYSVFNTVYNGRNDSRTARTLAMLVKTLPVVCHVDEKTVKELTASLQTQLMDSMTNDLYSYAEISRELGVKNDVMFIFQGDGFELTQFAGEETAEIPLELSDSKTAMTLQVTLKNGKLAYDLEYDPTRFTEKLMKAFAEAFDQAASGFIRTGSSKEIKLLSSSAEKEIEKYNDTQMDYDRSQTITGLFLEKVESRGSHLCVAFKNRRLTYEKVGDLTGKLALHLMKNGIGRGDVVAILISRNENMVLCAHGVLRSGAAFLGLDPTYPTERLNFMLQDCGAKYLIAERSLRSLLTEYDGPVLYTDEINAQPLDEAELARFAAMEKHQVTPENDCLLIYSSGTTGKPKGSILQHKAIVCFYHSYTKNVGINEDSRVAHYASFGFDGGTQDIFCALMAGAALYVIPDEIRMDLSSLENFYERNGITNGFMTTQVGCMFIAATHCKKLKTFMVGGEKLIPVTPPDWVTFKNGYGPSETYCYVNSYTVCSREKLQPIGKVSPNMKEYVIDRFGNRLPFGASGELCISGGQMGRGYLNRPEKTAEVFVTNPFSGEPGYERMYRTGDMVRLLTDGNFDFMERRDGQVKIRGFRVELAEVEQQIRKFEGVKGAVVQAPDNPAGGKYLYACVVADGELDIEKLKAFIGREKPDYMIPAAIRQIDEIPLTSNGKVDYKKLPKAEPGSTRKGIEPADSTEEKICQIFADVLGIEKVYADDDFFEIGGSSISGIQVIVRLEQAGLPVVYKNLFSNPTAQKLASFLQDGKPEDINSQDLETGDSHDYSALAYNVIPNLPEIKNSGIGNVLLTGSTGFLGSHVFKELMESTDANVICLVRSKNGQTAVERLGMIMVYYFEDWFDEEFQARTIVVDGELEDKDIFEKLEGCSFDTIINCAANVKHFAAGNELMGSNVSGVENLIELAEKRKAKLIQISSCSVCGESVNGAVPDGFIFRECDLNVGQSLENKYVYSKYLAEQAVIDAVSRKRITGKVIRLGNLMARREDSEFQVNAGSNGFLRLFLGFAKLGCFPVDMLDTEIEFSPIDSVAKAVVLLSGTPDSFTVFHAKNCNSIHYSYLLHSMMKQGKQIEVVENEIFEKRLEEALKDKTKVDDLGGLLAYRHTAGGSIMETVDYTGDEPESGSRSKRVKLSSSSTFTTKALYRLGFGWPLISQEYLDNMVRTLIDLNFF